MISSEALERQKVDKQKAGERMVKTV